MNQVEHPHLGILNGSPDLGGNFTVRVYIVPPRNVSTQIAGQPMSGTYFVVYAHGDEVNRLS